MKILFGSIALCAVLCLGGSQTAALIIFQGGVAVGASVASSTTTCNAITMGNGNQFTTNSGNIFVAGC